MKPSLRVFSKYIFAISTLKIYFPITRGFLSSLSYIVDIFAAEYSEIQKLLESTGG